MRSARRVSRALRRVSAQHDLPVRGVARLFARFQSLQRKRWLIGCGERDGGDGARIELEQPFFTQFHLGVIERVLQLHRKGEREQRAATVQLRVVFAIGRNAVRCRRRVAHRIAEDQRFAPVVAFEADAQRRLVRRKRHAGRIVPDE